MNVSVRRPVCTQRHTCSTAARQRPRVTSECVKINDVRLLDFQTGPVNFRIRHQITGADHVVHAKFLRKCNPEEVWDNAHDVQESNSVSDSDSDADFHVVARNIPPDVLADSSSNGAPPSPPQYAPASDSPLPYVLDVPDDILCQSDNDMDTSS